MGEFGEEWGGECEEVEGEEVEEVEAPRTCLSRVSPGK